MDSNNMNGNYQQNQYQQSQYQQPAYQQNSQAQYQNYQQTQYRQPYTQQPVYNNIYASNSVPDNYKPISPWGYVGYSILFAIPVVGLILLIVFSFSDSNINRRNYARSFWCVLLVAVILTVILVAIAAITGISLLNYLY